MTINRGTLMALVLATVACSDIATDAGDPDKLGTSDSSDPARQDVIELFTSWVSPGEVNALKALLALHEKSHPNTEVVQPKPGDGAATRLQLEARMAEGLPPNAVQLSLGTGLFKWSGSQPKLDPLQTFLSERLWVDAFYPVILAEASDDGVLYGLPINIHRTNTLFYNRALLQQYGISPPRTLDEFQRACSILSAAGITPIALGSTAWALSLLVHENLLVSFGGAAFYESFWRGEVVNPDKNPHLKNAYAEVLSWWKNGWFNKDMEKITWNEAARRLVSEGNERSAFFIGGDWVKGELEWDGQYKGDQDFGSVPFPGTAGTFIYTSDCIALPTGAHNYAGGTALLETFASREGQVAFNSGKGSIPARQDVPITALDAMQLTTAQDFAAAQSRVLSVSGLLRPDILSNLGAALTQMLRDASTDRGLRYWKNNYEMLQR
ncbi:MAG TPA: ABC transporter substrate-binding protein [Polyangiaceae bacterium]